MDMRTCFTDIPFATRSMTACYSLEMPPGWRTRKAAKELGQRLNPALWLPLQFWKPKGIIAVSDYYPTPHV